MNSIEDGSILVDDVSLPSNYPYNEIRDIGPVIILSKSKHNISHIDLYLKCSDTHGKLYYHTLDILANDADYNSYVSSLFT